MNRPHMVVLQSGIKDTFPLLTKGARSVPTPPPSCAGRTPDGADRISEMTPPPTAAEWTLATRHVGRRVLYYDELPSTLPVAAGLAADPANDGVAVLAGVQTA